MKLRITNTLARRYIQDFMNNNVKLLNIFSTPNRLLLSKELKLKLKVYAKIERVFNSCNEVVVSDKSTIESMQERFGTDQKYVFFENNRIRFLILIYENETYLGVNYTHIKNGYAKVKSKGINRLQKRKAYRKSKSRSKSSLVYKNKLSKLD